MIIKHNTHYHTYHLVTPSPWPFLASLGALITTVGGVMYIHFYKNGGFLLTFGFLFLLSVAIVWWRDIIRETTWENAHSQHVSKLIKTGVELFIVSEIIFFVAFFWAFFHSSITQNIVMGGVWPPKYVVRPFDITFPIFGTLFLIISSAVFGEAYEALCQEENSAQFVILSFITALFGITFLGIQVYEYLEYSFSINTDVFASTFLIATGFHGLHVIIGVCFILVCTVRGIRGHFDVILENKKIPVGVINAGLYWHFVDNVWLFLYMFMYVFQSGWYAKNYVLLYKFIKSKLILFLNW